MKTLILLFSVLFTTMSFAQVPSYVPANGLVGWWPFNGNANDESSNGNNGYMDNIGQNINPTPDRNGIANNATRFEGGNICGLPTSIGLSMISSRSLSLWFKSQMPMYTSGSIFKTSDNTWNIALINEYNYHKLYANATISNQFYGTTNPLYIVTSNWTNVVFICDSINQVSKLYINGLLYSNTTTGNGFSSNTQNPAIYIAGENSNSQFGYMGSIDDIGIWNRALTECEIQNLYTSTNPTNTITTATACDSYVWNGQTYTASGVYTGTNTDCVTQSLNLTITPSSTNTTTATACDSYLWNGTTYTASGVYTGTTANCVTESLNLTITPSSTNTTPASACDNYTWNGQTYTQSGVYTGATINCVTQFLNLTITPSSTITQPASQSINISNNAQFIVGSSGSNAIYQWQTDLGIGFQNLNSVGQYSGTSNNTLTVSNVTFSNNNQPFRCIVSSGSCTDTSDVAVLTVVNNVGFNDLSTSKLSIYPNPTNGDFTITGLELVGTVSSLILTDMNGKIVKVLDTKATKFTMGGIKPGVYFLNILSGNKQEVLKIVKE
jgi:hypothetical protein